MFHLGFIGQHPKRYGGLSYGNISQRLGAGFVISATQTGGMETLQPRHYCLVEQAEIETNRVIARGIYPPSSEALSHAAIYQASAKAHVVVHGHCPDIWRQSVRLGLPETPPDAGYGTPALALAVKRLVKGLPAAGVIVMRGHQDGVLAYGATPEQAGQLLVDTLARAWTLTIAINEEGET